MAKVVHTPAAQALPQTYAVPARPAPLDPAAARDLAAIVRRIAREPSRTKRKRLEEQLALLLMTPVAPASEVVRFTAKSLNQSVRDARAKKRASPNAVRVAAQEFRRRSAHLTRMQVTLPWWPGAHVVHVDRRDPADVFVALKVKLTGDAATIAKIRELEEAIEEHLRIPGFTVHLKFTTRRGLDVFEVRCDPTKWPTAGNWVGGAKVLAHELLHLLGLDDEYKLTDHATNVHMPREQRLRMFREALRLPPPPADGVRGIMANQHLKPLQRHALAAAGHYRLADAALAGAEAALASPHRRRMKPANF